MIYGISIPWYEMSMWGDMSSTALNTIPMNVWMRGVEVITW